jgi:hypothetical protein
MPPLARCPVMPSGGTEKGSVCIRKTNFRTLVKASSASPNCLRTYFHSAILLRAMTAAAFEARFSQMTKKDSGNGRTPRMENS